MVKNILILGIFLFSFFFFVKSEKRGTQIGCPDGEERGVLIGCPENQPIDTICCIVDNEFVYNPFGKIRFTEKNLTDSIFKGVYREKCRIGYGYEEEDYTFYLFKAAGGQYRFMKFYQKDEYFPDYVEIISNYYTLLHINKGGQKIKTGYTKEEVAEILGIKGSTICDCLRITDEEGNCDIMLYFAMDRLKKIDFQCYL